MSLNLDDTSAGKPLGPAAAAVSSLLPVSVSRRRDLGIQGAGAQQSRGAGAETLALVSRQPMASDSFLLVECMKKSLDAYRIPLQLIVLSFLRLPKFSSFSRGEV